MQLIINIVAPMALMAATALGAALPVKRGFTSHEVTKADGSKAVLYLRSDFVATTTTAAVNSSSAAADLAGRDPPPPPTVSFTPTDQPVANCPVEMSYVATDDSVPPATVSDCDALMAAMLEKKGYWSATNWLSFSTLASVGTCKFSAFRWDGNPGELKIGNLDVWAWIDMATTQFVVKSNQIQAFGNGPCAGDNNPNIRFDLGNQNI